MALLPPMPHQNAYIHPSGEDLIAILAQFLPNSIALHRRLSHPQKSKHAVILATFPPPSPPRPDGHNASTNGTTHNPPSEPAHPHCFAAAYIDRSQRPATELWIFTSGEIDKRCDCAKELGVTAVGDIPDTQASSSSKREIPNPPCAAAVLTLVRYIARNVPFPPYTPAHLADVERAARLVEELRMANAAEHPGAGKSHYPAHGTFLADIHDATVLKMGAVAALPSTVLFRHGVLRTPPIRDFAHALYVFRVGELPRGRELPRGLVWGEVREGDFDLVRIRSPIPKTHETLRAWKGLGVYPKAGEDGEGSMRAVAWAFEGYDGSLTSMHVEPECRGKGIAKTLAARLFTLYPHVDGWAHAYVGVGNRESEAVCGGIGGTVETWCWWLRLELEAVKQLQEV